MLDLSSVRGLLQAAGHDAVLQGLAIVAGTFVLEDAATILAAAQVKAGAVPLHVALAALYVGIVLGDLGLYGLGWLASRFRWARRWAPERKARNSRTWIEAHVFRVVFISRFIPGARLPSYTACGFLHADFRRFALAAVVATLIWTSALFAVSLQVGEFLADHLGAWRWAGVLTFVLAVVIVGKLAARLHEDAA
jgi:membrane protein DedA with SNARE-associated domain